MLCAIRPPAVFGDPPENHTLKVLRLAVFVLLSILGWQSGSATAAEPALAGRLTAIKASGAVRVCIWPEYYSISYRNPRSGKLEGIDIDMAHHLAADLGVAVRFIDSSFKTLIADLLENRCDISMHGVGITPQRQEKLVFSPPYLRGGIYAVANKSNPAVKTWADIDKAGMIVAAQAGTYMVPAMKETLKAAQLVEVQSPEAREAEVTSGRADVFVTDYPYSRKMVAIHDWAVTLAPPTPLAPFPYAYAMAPGDPAWEKTVADFVRRCKADGRLAKAAKDNSLDAIVDLN